MKSEVLVIRVSPELKAGIKKSADAEGKSVSEFITDLAKIAVAKTDRNNRFDD